MKRGAPGTTEEERNSKSARVDEGPSTIQNGDANDSVRIFYLFTHINNNPIIVKINQMEKKIKTLTGLPCKYRYMIKKKKM